MNRPLTFTTPAAEVDIDESLVRRLLATQHPDLADLPLSMNASGWDNMMYRLGDQLAVRLPRRRLGQELILNEQKWLPTIAPHLTLPVPEPIRTGSPGEGYPWSWSVVRWLEGEMADAVDLEGGEAIRLGLFLRSLHHLNHENAPLNPFRGGQLSSTVERIEPRMGDLEERTDLITPELRDRWSRSVEVPIDAEPRLLHGDLHPHNILVRDGEISGIIDWGDITAGDPACDLAIFWMLFDDPDVRRDGLNAYGPLSEATIMRAEGWAISFGVTLLHVGLADTPRFAEIGRRTLGRVPGE